MLMGAMGTNTAHADVLYTGSCYDSEAYSQYYWLVDYATLTPYTSTTSIPSVSTVNMYCTAGTKHKLQPVNPPSFDGSEICNSLGVVWSCTACADGYELQTLPGPFNWGGYEDSVSCTSLTNLTVQTCVKSADTDTGTTTPTCTSSNCASSAWANHSTGYLTRTYRSCSSDGTTCNESTQYTCAKGYFGTSSSYPAIFTSASGCGKCPLHFSTKDGGTYETTTAVGYGMNSVSGCYVVATGDVTEFTDASGTYVFTPYSNPTEYCYYDFGSCSGYTTACTTSSGTMYAVVSGTKTHSASGTHCWCNVNGKSFYFASQSTAAACASNCSSMCANAVFGFAANGYIPMVSWSDLGCI